MYYSRPLYTDMLRPPLPLTRPLAYIPESSQQAQTGPSRSQQPCSGPLSGLLGPDSYWPLHRVTNQSDHIYHQPISGQSQPSQGWEILEAAQH